MHVTRGGWLGQTFALAKFDDSFEGKKSGVRRSKEERKGMVETFIKRYQKLNNGDFPSLNLTRKEVGGSFYTVREIVREIIQENRVLGPPKSPPGDKNTENLDSFLEHHPLGSMSVDHHVRVVPPKDAQTIHEYEFRSEQILNTRSIPKLYQGKLDSDNLVDESMNKTEGNEEANDPRFTELLVERGEEEHKVDEEVINVETSHSLDVKLSEREVLDGGLEEKGTENKKVATENNERLVSNEMDLFNKSTDMVDIKSEEEITHPLSESEPPLASQKAESHSSTKENVVLHVNDNTYIKLEDTLPAEEKTINGANARNLHSKTSSISVQQSMIDERSANLNKSGDQPGADSQTRTNATLNRINLESWEASSKKSNGGESHRFVTFIKAFITAFVKFWS